MNGNKPNYMNPWSNFFLCCSFFTPDGGGTKWGGNESQANSHSFVPHRVQNKGSCLAVLHLANRTIFKMNGFNIEGPSRRVPCWQPLVSHFLAPPLIIIWANNTIQNFCCFIRSSHIQQDLHSCPCTQGVESCLGTARTATATCHEKKFREGRNTAASELSVLYSCELSTFSDTSMLMSG